MPIYEYACGKCGHEFEALQRMSEDPLKKCPACNKMALAKKVSAAAFVLKGTGWYETDFKDKKKPDAQEGDSKSADGGAANGEAKEAATSDGKAADTASVGKDAKPKKTDSDSASTGTKAKSSKSTAKTKSTSKTS